MNRRWIAVLALWPATLLAQPVFFDDFDGNALLPHWHQPAPSEWAYNVSNSMLNVTGLFYPSHPKSPTNYAYLAAFYTPQTDFQLDCRMGWGTREGVARFELTVLVNNGGVATIGYRDNYHDGLPFGIFAGTSAGLVTIPVPPPGNYDFRITRVGAYFDFFFEGSLFAHLPSAYTGPVNGLDFFFSSPYPGVTGPFRIDRVQVVPVPGTTGILLLVFAMAGCRHRTVETLHV